MVLSTYMTLCGCSSEPMAGQAWLDGGTFAHGAAGPPMVHFPAYSSGSAQVTAMGPTAARFYGTAGVTRGETPDRQLRGRPFRQRRRIWAHESQGLSVSI
jgi:hypothetical protein